MFLLFCFCFPNVIYLHVLLLACGLVCVLCEVRIGEESGAGCIHSVYTRRPGRCLAEMTAAAALTCPPPPPPPSTHSLFPSFPCSLMSWQLMLEDTHGLLQTRAEGTFQLLRQCLDCCCCPFCPDPPSPPCHPLSSPVMQRLLCHPSSFADLGLALIVVFFAASWLLVLFC